MSLLFPVRRFDRLLRTHLEVIRNPDPAIEIQYPETVIIVVVHHNLGVQEQPLTQKADVPSGILDTGECRGLCLVQQYRGIIREPGLTPAVGTVYVGALRDAETVKVQIPFSRETPPVLLKLTW